MKAVIGLGFGDEGKGLTTSFLCSQANDPVVVRFNGGHQAGHTVVHEGKRHVFSNFGSGSLQGASTFWSKFCTFSPECVVNEYQALIDLGLTPSLMVDGLCPVSTPYDVFHNQQRESELRHGSVGMGFGATLQRQEDFYKLHVQDLAFNSVLRAKLKNIAAYYGNPALPDGVIERFIVQCENSLNIINEGSIYASAKSIQPEYIFEGAQGVLLDQDHGFFPNVTRSNTTSKNIFQLLGCEEIYYVTRTYQTRHGNGFMTNEDLPVDLVNNELETNEHCEWQGVFRKSVLDIDLLSYALKCDYRYSAGRTKNLVISCVDQTGFDFCVTVKGKVRKINIEELPRLLPTWFDKVFYSTGPSFEDIKLLSGLSV